MPDTKITALTALTAADPANDVLPIVDVSDTTMAASGTTKKISINNVLGCSGTATLASATITGNLTVDTNTFFVDSSTNNVGLGTLAPSGASGRVLEIYGGAGQSRLVLKNDTTGSASTDGSQIALAGSQLVIQNREASEITFETNNSERYRLASDGVATWSNVGGVAGTAMTLNSTGLGVGGSPVAASKLTVVGGNILLSNAYYLSSRNAANTTSINLIGRNASDEVIIDADGYGTKIGAGSALQIVSSGNVGIGVTPSAAVAGNRKIEIGGNTNAGLTLSSSSANASARNWSALCNFNAFGDLCFNQSNALGGDPIAAGTTRMTLDASGNLILLSSNTPATLTTNGQLTVNATSNTNLRFSYRGSDGTTRVANITLA